MAVITNAQPRPPLGSMDFYNAGLGPYLNAGTPTSGAGGTLAGQAAKGALLVDTAAGVLYINTGTLAIPTWTKVGTQT